MADGFPGVMQTNFESRDMPGGIVDLISGRVAVMG